MYNITFIGTHHLGNGKCNPDELHKILESIKPEVIFQELSSNLFDTLYNNNAPTQLLEVICIKKYLQRHKIKICPVDVDVSLKLTAEMEKMHFIFYKYDNVYKKLYNEHTLLVEQEGFHYLNSKKYLDLLEEIEVRERQLIDLNSIYKDKLLPFYISSHKENDNRENEWLKYIYNYSKINLYNQAVFLFGADHRKSIMQKIPEFEGKAEIKINWTFYNSTLMNKKAYH